MDPVPVAINVNENPYPVPESVTRHISESIARVLPGLNRYPDREFTRLREHLAAYLNGVLLARIDGQHRSLAADAEGAASEMDRADRLLGDKLLTPDHIWAANGSNEVLQHILQAFAGPGRRVLGFPPTYSMHPIITRGVGAEWVEAERAAGYAITAEVAVAAIERERPDVTFFCAPNNPTGTPVDLDVIARAYNATDGIVVVDEAYAEFMPVGAPSALELLPGRPRLIVSRTMSKAFAFAGVRLGYFAAHPSVADAARLVRLPYHLSAMTQAAACAALECAPTMLEQVDAIRVQRDRLETGLRELGYAPYPSAANFVLASGFTDPHATFSALRERGILVRDIGIPNCLRITAGTPEETTAVLRALADLRGDDAVPSGSERGGDAVTARTPADPTE